jgi:hypothetical protein
MIVSGGTRPESWSYLEVLSGGPQETQADFSETHQIPDC